MKRPYLRPDGVSGVKVDDVNKLPKSPRSGRVTVLEVGLQSAERGPRRCRNRQMLPSRQISSQHPIIVMFGIHRSGNSMQTVAINFAMQAPGLRSTLGQATSKQAGIVMPK